MIILGNFLSFPQSTQPRIARLGHLSPLSFAAIALFLILLGGGILYMEYQDHRTLWQDFKMRQRHQILPDAEISSKNYCFNSRGTITGCKIAFRYQGQIYLQEIKFFATSAKELPPLNIVQSLDNPLHLSSDFALQKLGGRFLQAAVFMGLGALLIIMCLLMFFFALPLYRRILSELNQWHAQPWQIVGLSNWKQIRGQYVLTFQVNGKNKHININSKHMSPWLVSIGIERYMLAVMPKHGGLPAPLDDKLKVISGLSKKQKQAVKHHIEQLIAQRNPLLSEQT